MNWIKNILKNKALHYKVIRYLFTILITYSAYATFFYLTQSNIMFPIEYARVPYGIEQKVPDSQKFWVETEFGRSEVWHLPPDSNSFQDKYPLIIVAHGNGDVIDRWLNVVGKLRESGLGILLVEYPGYGRSTGDPSEESISAVFAAAYDSVITNESIDKNKIILLGQSIGGGVVCNLADIRPTSAIILISTFTSVDVFARQYFLPTFLVIDKFDNLTTVSNYDGPTLFIHGTDDDLIPYDESQALASVAKNGTLLMLNGGHNLRLNDEFWSIHVIPFLIRNSILKE